MITICFLSVSLPLSFEKEKNIREKEVKERLGKIRMAEEAYRQKYGGYTAEFALLIKEKLLADSLQYIPYAGKKKFHLSASTIETKNGRQIPVMQCYTTFNEYMAGMKENEVANMIQTAEENGNFPGLKIGDIAEDNSNTGNWE